MEQRTQSIGCKRWSALGQVLRLSGPMFWSWRLGGLLGLLVVIAMAGSGCLIWESFQREEFISALAARDAGRFQRSLLTFIGILVASAWLQSFSVFVRDTLGLRWRQGLTRQFLGTYLDQKRFYRLAVGPPAAAPDAVVDNPDQRLSEDIKSVSQTTLLVFIIGLESIVQLVGFVWVLWFISKALTGFLVVYAGLGSAIATLFFGKRLTRINAEQLKREANFRFGLINVRENAESIAFYQGQAHESRTLQGQFSGVVANFNRFIRWQLGLDFFQNGYQYLTFIMPSLILAPSILAGQLEVGTIFQSQLAFDRIWLSLSLVVVQFEQLTALAASVDRLGVFAQSLQAVRTQDDLAIQTVISPMLAVQNLTVYTPDSQRRLCQDLSFEVPAGASLLVTGPSGVGKSALLKTLAGLWTAGQGTLQAPQASLFLPQQPYLPLGSLRRQLLYPHGNEAMTDEALIEALKQVQLLGLSQMLETVADWSQRLSLGEQQRLSFARLLLQRPAYAILDEATSAVAVEQEQGLYQCLVEAGITVISVGHRPSLLPYHLQVLTLALDHSWTLQSTQDYRFV
ncbi:MAG: ABC transporter ATP-binding protein/permease [Cyanobacteria bacterium J06639_14]